jgi:hypothetical protein
MRDERERESRRGYDSLTREREKENRTSANAKKHSIKAR